MICSKCGWHDRVIRTISDGDEIVRVRRCIKCGNREITTERIMTPDEQQKRKKHVGRPRAMAAEQNE